MAFDMNIVRDRLRDAMSAANIGAKPLAKKAGLGETAVRDIREGNSLDPRISTLAALADALEVDFNYLIGSNGVPSKVVSIWESIPDEDRPRAIQVLEAFRKSDDKI
jgi:transcriptional regulator with XRE-family HTH domain